MRLGMAVSLAVLMGALSSFPAKASTKPKAPPPPVDTRILVTAVNLPNQQITFTYQDNKKRQVTYVVDQITTVTVQGQKGTLKDIKVGQQVANYVERDGQTLDSIEVETADPPPAAPPKK